MKRRAAGPPRHRLVEIVAHQMERRLGGRVRMPELYDMGVPGLVLAQREWDGRGQFDPFAMERIRWAMVDELRKRRRDPLSMAVSASDLAGEQYGCTRQELYATAENPQQEAEETIDEVVDAGGANYGVDIDGASRVEDDANRIRLRRAIAELPPPQDAVMERYIYHQETFQEVGEALGMSGAACCKLHAKAVATLKRRLGERDAPSVSPPGPP